MAKLKGPLMSLTARGQIGKSLVFSGWKGIATARHYVVPANPRTAGQLAQRATLTALVAGYHASALNALDKAALSVGASLAAKVMSGFNWFIQRGTQILALPKTVVVARGFSVATNTGGSIGLSIFAATGEAALVAHGVAPRVLGTPAALTYSSDPAAQTLTVTGLTPGEYIYFYFTTVAAGKELISGYYKVLVLA